MLRASVVGCVRCEWVCPRVLGRWADLAMGRISGGLGSFGVNAVRLYAFDSDFLLHDLVN